MVYLPQVRSGAFQSADQRKDLKTIMWNALVEFSAKAMSIIMIIFYVILGEMSERQGLNLDEEQEEDRKNSTSNPQQITQ